MNLVTRLGRKLSLAGIIVTVAGVGWLLVLVAGAHGLVAGPGHGRHRAGHGAAVIGIGVLSALAVPLLPRRAQAGH